MNKKHNRKLAQALDQISDDKIAEAAGAKKRRPYRIGAVAAVLTLVLLLGGPAEPLVTSAYAISAAEYPDMAAYPTDRDNASYDQDLAAWTDSLNEQREQPAGYADSLSEFWASGIPVLLSGEEGENQVCSPLNIYMALAMLAETAGGESRAQILDALGAGSIEALRQQANHVWNAHYLDDGASATILANSLWLDDAVTYNQSALVTLAENYYASSFQGNLGSREMNRALRTWLNEQTGGLLEEQIQNVGMREETVMALASTIYFRAKWSSEFSEKANTEAPFHAPGRDVTATFMNTSLRSHTYYWGEDFSAIRLELNDGSGMWLFLPEEGKTPSDLLTSGGALELALSGRYEGRKVLKVNLSLPKFDVSANMELNDKLMDLGITDVFSGKADFSPSIQEPRDVSLDSATHAARVKIDEEGMEGAAYTVFLYDLSSTHAPDTEEIDFILDRPFLFVVTSHDDLPLFAGVVNEP